MTQATLARQAAVPAADSFQTGRVLTVAGGHLIHDTFTSFLPPLLPLIIQKLGLSLTLAGSLAAFQQFPGLINPLLGLLADRGSLRWLAILAPTLTAAAMSLSAGVRPAEVNVPQLQKRLIDAGVVAQITVDRIDPHPPRIRRPDRRGESMPPNRRRRCRRR